MGKSYENTIYMKPNVNTNVRSESSASWNPMRFLQWLTEWYHVDNRGIHFKDRGCYLTFICLPIHLYLNKAKLEFFKLHEND